MRILVVEDDKKVARALREGLQAEHYDVRVVSTGEEGFFLVNHELFDLVLLDLMLPRRDGIEVLTTLRKRGLQTPVLILTARDTVEDRVQGLDLGADDYLVKPFAFPELVARIRALLRHQGRVVSREMLARDVWQVAARATPLDNVIDVSIARLRRKIDDPFEKKLLHTIRGMGFMLAGKHE